MSLSDLHDISDIDQIFNIVEPPKPIDKTIRCCDQRDATYVNSASTCINCGSVNYSDNLKCYKWKGSNIKWRPYQPYKRLIYMRQKLALVSCLKDYPMAPKLLYFIDLYKGRKFRSLYKLKSLMKRHKLNKFYKHIYSIYYRITNKKVIALNYHDINNLTSLFLGLERAFKQQNVRKNLYSYNVIIYYLLKKTNVANYMKILLPLNKNKIKRKVEALMHISEIN
jgi:hypothetical protein